MNELPQPMAPQQIGSTPSDPQLAQMVPVDGRVVDDKVLEERAAEQIDSIIVQTATNPYERANQIHALKSAFLRTRHGVENNDGAQ